jgi:pilus assembly protein FimV
VRKTILRLSVAGLLAAFSPWKAYSLGLGEIEVKSKLNQPLRAEITLHGVHALSLEDIKVKLASNEQFLRAGLERAWVLNNLHFRTLRKKTGETVVEVTSQEPIREPFLNFLATVIWPQGHLLREYVVLLDLPFPQDLAPTVARAVTEKVKPAAELNAPTALDVRPAADSATVPLTAKAALSTYGPIGPTDTLWLIAQRLQPKKSLITPQQMMLALQEANPDAFLHHNINGLLIGKVLKVPEEDEVLRLISAVEAAHQVQQQNQTWAALVGKGALLERQAQGTKADGSKESGVLGSEARSEANILVAQEQNFPQQEAELEAKRSGGRIDDFKVQLSLVRDTLQTRTQENEEIQARLRQLELQVKTLKQLLSAKDASIVGLRKSSETATEEGQTLKDQGSGALTLSTKELEPSASSPSVEMDLPSSGKETFEIISPISSASLVAMEMAPNQARPAEELSGEKMDQFEGALGAFITLRNLLLFGGSSMLLLTLIIWRMRKRKTTGKPVLSETEQEADWSEPIAVLDRRTDRGVIKIAGEPTSLVAAVQAEAYEAIAEADGHLASNHHGKAAKVLKTALGKEPERQDLKLKLAEVYYAMGNGEAFMALIEEWIPNQSENDAIWAELVAMGRILSPSHPLFVGLQQGYEEIHEGMEIVSSSHSSDLSPWLLTSDEETTELFSPTGGSALEARISNAEDRTLEFDLAGIALAEYGTSAGGAISKVREIDEEEGEARLELGDFPSSLEEEKISKKSLGSFPLEFETQEGNTALEVLETGASDVEAATPTVTNFANIDATDSSSSAEEIGTFFSGKALMDDLDEMEIKLDLARAYIDTGDAEEACGILEEVIAAGNEEQRGTGQELLKLAKAS